MLLSEEGNKRVDHLLGALLKIARDKAFEAWEKLEKGKRNNKIKEIDKRHKNLLLLQTNVDRISENEWKFPSPTLENVIYSEIKESDCDQYKMRCSSCGVAYMSILVRALILSYIQCPANTFIRYIQQDNYCSLRWQERKS